MAQSVVYADLKFAVSPPLTAPTCPAAPDEDDSPYENVPLGPVPVTPGPGGTPLSQGRWPRRWLIPGGLLAASLLLLVLLVATVALGVCYWQVSRRLQDTSRDHTAEQGRLSQEVSERERSLEQAWLELAWARAELQRAWREGNSSQLELGSLNIELGSARQELAALRQQVQDVQGELRASQGTVSSLRACVNTECCPSGWVLYRNKCLFISVEKKTWSDSRDDCRKKGAQLLAKGDWDLRTVPHFVEASSTPYWVGVQFSRDTKKTPIWQDSKQSRFNYFADCGLSTNKKIESSNCWLKYQWICEQPPNLSSTPETLHPLLKA